MSNSITRPRFSRDDWPAITLIVTLLMMAVIFGANLVVAQDADRSFSVRLPAADGSETWGRVKLIESGAETRVIVAIHGDVEGSFVSHIHTGSCDAYDGEPTFPLAVFDATDRSRTTVAASIDDLISGAYLVDIHPYSDKANEILDPDTAIVCGSLESAIPVDGVGGEIVTSAPNTGIGPIDTRYSGTMLLPILAAVAIACAGARIVFTRRPKPAVATYRPYDQMGNQ